MRRAAFLFSVTTILFAASTANADQSIIKNPNDHPDYRFEAEPHLLLGFGGPFRGGAAEGGMGFRGTFILLDNGFIPKLNNSVGLSFGGDVFFGRGTVVVPFALQWNFWLTTHWSVFGEPGIAFAANAHPGRSAIHPTFAVGGRFHFNDKVALTFRLGYPAFSAGVSFFF